MTAHIHMAGSARSRMIYRRRRSAVPHRGGCAAARSARAHRSGEIMLDLCVDAEGPT
jgi:hypothetical protein